MADYPVKSSKLYVQVSSSWEEIGQVQTVGAVGGSAGKRDVTHLGSTAMEYKPAIFDPAALSFSVIVDFANRGWDVATERITEASTTDSFKVVLPTTTKVATFTGYFSKCELTGADVQGTWMGNIEVQPTGPITWPAT